MGVWSKKYSQLFLFNCTVQWDFNGIIDTALAKSLYVKLCQIYLLNNIAMEFLIESNLRSSVSHLFCATRVFILIFCFVFCFLRWMWNNSMCWFLSSIFWISKIQRRFSLGVKNRIVCLPTVKGRWKKKALAKGKLFQLTQFDKHFLFNLVESNKFPLGLLSQEQFLNLRFST